MAAPRRPLSRRRTAARDNASMSVVKINVLTVPENMKDELERRFAGRAGLVEGAEDVEQGALAGPGGAHDGERVAALERKRDTAKDRQWAASRGVVLGEVFDGEWHAPVSIQVWSAASASVPRP